MGDKESSLDVAAVWVFPYSVKDLIVEINIVDVDGIVKSYGDHLRHFQAVSAVRTKVSGHLGPRFRAKAIGQAADCLVARGSSVGVVFNV